MFYFIICSKCPRLAASVGRDNLAHVAQPKPVTCPIAAEVSRGSQAVRGIYVFTEEFKREKHASAHLQSKAVSLHHVNLSATALHISLALLQHLLFYYRSHPLLTPSRSRPPSPSFPNSHFGSAPGHWVTAVARFSHCSLYWTPHRVNQGEQMWRRSHQLSATWLWSYRWACLISGPGAERTDDGRGTSAAMQMEETWRQRKHFSLLHIRPRTWKTWNDGNVVRLLISLHHYIKLLNPSQYSGRYYKASSL